MADTETEVQALANLFAAIEDRAKHIRKDARDMRDHLEALRDNAVIGGLETNAKACAIDALATEFEARIWAMHREWTVRAQELGVDLPSIESGGR